MGAEIITILSAIRYSKSLPIPRDDFEKEIMVKIYRKYRIKSFWNNFFSNSEEETIRRYEEELKLNSNGVSN